MCVFLLTVSVYPVFAVEYNPGVSVGQYVKYGNIVGTQNGENINEIDWLLIEVIAVSGKEVTLRTSGQFNNGTAIPTSGRTIVYNIENGTMTSDNMTSSYAFGPIIAANLNEGDLIPPTSYSYIVNETETRMYLNVSRSVNILNMTYSDANFTNKWSMVFDKASGMMLEFLLEFTQTADPATTTNSSYSVVETNIFTTSAELPFYLQQWFLIAIIVIVVAVIVVVAFLMRRKRTP